MIEIINHCLLSAIDADGPHRGPCRALLQAMGGCCTSLASLATIGFNQPAQTVTVAGRTWRLYVGDRNEASDGTGGNAPVFFPHFGWRNGWHSPVRPREDSEARQCRASSDSRRALLTSHEHGRQRARQDDYLSGPMGPAQPARAGTA